TVLLHFKRGRNVAPDVLRWRPDFGFRFGLGGAFDDDVVADLSVVLLQFKFGEVTGPAGEAAIPSRGAWLDAHGGRCILQRRAVDHPLGELPRPRRQRRRSEDVMTRGGHYCTTLARFGGRSGALSP